MARNVGPDLLRALAILLVMLWHLPKAATPDWLLPAKPFGWIGVDLFFVLSGYLIGSPLLTGLAGGRGVDLPAFYLRRSFRILPAYLVMLAIYAALPIVREADGMPPLWRFLSFTMNFGLDYDTAGTFSHAWSLCVEQHFYLALPLLLLLPLRSTRAILTLAAAILLGGMAVRAALWEEALLPRLADSRAAVIGYDYLEAIYYPTYCRLDGLAFGVLLALVRVYRAEPWRRHVDPRWMLAAGLLCVAAALALFAYRGALAPTRAHLPVLSLPAAIAGYPLLALGFTLILAAFLDGETRLRRWRLPGATAVAAISYSLYLCHKSIMHLDELWLGDRLQGWPGLVVYYGSSLAAGALLWAAVERPFLRLRGRALARSAAPPAVNSPGAG